jgi:hypothetical protein
VSTIVFSKKCKKFLGRFLVPYSKNSFTKSVYLIENQAFKQKKLRLLYFLTGKRNPSQLLYFFVHQFFGLKLLFSHKKTCPMGQVFKAIFNLNFFLSGALLGAAIGTLEFGLAVLFARLPSAFGTPPSSAYWPIPIASFFLQRPSF